MTRTAKQFWHWASERLRTRTAWMALAVAVAGFAIRVWVAMAPIGQVDSDMAVLGLMARANQHGDFAVFHWGQAYGGAQETYLVALLGVFTGVNKAVLQLTTILLTATATGFLWLVTKEALSRHVANVAAALFWLWPGPFVWWSIKIGSNYWYALTVALAIVWLMLRLRTRPATPVAAAALGALLAQAVWANPQTVYVVFPAACFCLKPLWGVVRHRLVFLASAAIVSGLPWLYVNVPRRFPSLHTPPGDLRRPHGLDGVREYLSQYIPMILGTKEPLSHEWLGTMAIGVVLTILVGALLLLVAVRHTRALALPLFGVIVFSVTFPFTLWVTYVNEPRYAFWLAPWLVMIVAFAITRITWRPRLAPTVAVAVAACITVQQLARMEQPGSTTQSANMANMAIDVATPANDHDLIALLEANDVRYAWGDYWISYRTIFETNGRLIVAPYYTDRRPEYSEAVTNSPTPAPYVFISRSQALPRFLTYLQSVGATGRSESLGAYTLVFPSQAIDPNLFNKTLKGLAAHSGL